MAEIDEFNLPRRIALVHDWFTPRSVGGAEQVVRAIDELLLKNGSHPDFVALVDGESQRIGSWLFGRNVQTSFIQKLPWGVNHVQKYLPLLPYAIEPLPFVKYGH